jgi:hypothetical protein
MHLSRTSFLVKLVILNHGTHKISGFCVTRTVLRARLMNFSLMKQRSDKIEKYFHRVLVQPTLALEGSVCDGMELSTLKSMNRFNQSNMPQRLYSQPTLLNPPYGTSSVQVPAVLPPPPDQPITPMENQPGQLSQAVATMTAQELLGYSKVTKMKRDVYPSDSRELSRNPRQKDHLYAVIVPTPLSVFKISGDTLNDITCNLNPTCVIDVAHSSHAQML